MRNIGPALAPPWHVTWGAGVGSGAGVGWGAVLGVEEGLGVGLGLAFAIVALGVGVGGLAAVGAEPHAVTHTTRAVRRASLLIHEA